MTAPSEQLSRLLRNARQGRCLLRDYWNEGASLSGRDQLKLARGLREITPARIERNGRRVPCEPRFELKAKDRRRLVEALIADGVSEQVILPVVPGLSRRTFERIRSDTRPAKTGPANRSSKRRISPKRDAPVGGPRIVSLDATSGADAEAESAFRALVGGAT